jgi:hypothetical protein
VGAYTLKNLMNGGGWMMVENSRISRERRTIAAMIRIYCRDQHAQAVGLCADCETLRLYAEQRLDRCVFGVEKPTCANCPVHCYKRDRREQIRVVMRYAGPKMLLKHPVLAIWHLLDGKRKAPLLASKKKSGE